MVKKKITFLEEIEEVMNPTTSYLNICEKCSYRELPVCPMMGTELCTQIRGV